MTTGAIDVSLPNQNHLVIGTSGSGKSTWVKRRIKGARRLIVWDPDGEYPVMRYHRLSELVAHLQAIQARHGAVAFPFRAAYCADPTPENFELFNRLVWALLHPSAPLVYVAEEIADVTPPGKAPPAWGKLIRRGRKRGAQIYAVTQRPAECDKTIYSQAPYKWVGVLENEADRARIATLVGVAATELAQLGPLQYLYKCPGADTERGKLTIRRGKR